MSKRKYKVTFVDQWLEGDVYLKAGCKKLKIYILLSAQFVKCLTFQIWRKVN